MNIEAVTPTADIGSDLLFRVDGRFVRARITRTQSDAEIMNTLDDTTRTLNFKFSCALAVDESGDVLRGDDGKNIIFPAEVHGITLDSLKDEASINAWLVDTARKMITRTMEKTALLEAVTRRFPLTPQTEA